MVIGAEDHLRVCSGAERIAHSHQFIAQFDIIIDLAVVNDDALFSLHGLSTFFTEIDDGESTMAQAEMTG